ncbi:Kae1-like domain-containing protein [Ideonella paludis]|uniref:Carbamoyltransferase HypF n=1 Tax=Ideonella paludis TaxID=1233411 RepID=A0ABS5E109_9BURK|nr:carbamoyltransferase HypF [Ideonella paludis]MBQ0937095.1 carbamoyltransferase HypF [Ideonella paludis]
MLQPRRLPRPAPARVLALGAYLKNSACLVQGEALWCSPVHGDLGEPAACEALWASAQALRQAADGPIEAVAHDLHPDFESTRLAQALAAEWGVPAIAVQHHQAHIAAVQAEHGLRGPLLGLALDGVGLGDDGTAWGGELLLLQDGGAAWQRLGHLPTLALPGGDVAAREPWRMAAAAMQASGRSADIISLLAPAVGEPAVRLLSQMLARGLNCPPTTAAGRWFDAAAGLLGLSVRQSQEAEAAMALEALATAWRAQHPEALWPDLPMANGMPDLRALVPMLTQARQAAQTEAKAEAAAHFHSALAQGLARAALAAARQTGATQLALAGGCFFNRLLCAELHTALAGQGLKVWQPQQFSCGDAGLALGQAWAAAHALHRPAPAAPPPSLLELEV